MAQEKRLKEEICTHQDFKANVNVCRRTDNDEITVIGFSADIRIKCNECGQDFEFIGVEPGSSPFGPKCSMDSMELRIPIKPSTGQLAFENTSYKN